MIRVTLLDGRTLNYHDAAWAKVDGRTATLGFTRFPPSYGERGVTARSEDVVVAVVNLDAVQRVDVTEMPIEVSSAGGE